MTSFELFNPFHDGEGYLTSEEIGNRIEQAGIRLAGPEELKEVLRTPERICAEFGEVEENVIFYGAIRDFFHSPLGGSLVQKWPIGYGRGTPEPVVSREQVEKTRYTVKMIPLVTIPGGARHLTPSQIQVEFEFKPNRFHRWQEFHGFGHGKYDRVACIK